MEDYSQGILSRFSLKEHKQNKFFKEYNIKEIKNTPVVFLIPTKNQEEFKKILRKFKADYIQNKCNVYLCHFADHTSNYFMKEILALMFKDNPNHFLSEALFTPEDVYEVDYRVKFLNYWLRLF